jgi:hypothetical protein
MPGPRAAWRTRPRRLPLPILLPTEDRQARVIPFPSTAAASRPIDHLSCSCLDTKYKKKKHRGAPALLCSRARGDPNPTAPSDEASDEHESIACVPCSSAVLCPRACGPSTPAQPTQHFLTNKSTTTSVAHAAILLYSFLPKIPVVVVQQQQQQQDCTAPAALVQSLRVDRGGGCWIHPSSLTASHV